MVGAVLEPPLWIELPAVVAGALFAQKRGLDVIGILAPALVTGLGGGIMRDILLARIPLALRDSWYLWTVAGAAVIGAFFAQAVNRMRVAMQLIDAVSLGLFSVIGAQGALRFRLPVPSAVLLGTITGVGGSVLRDVLVGDVPPRMLRRGAPYASAAFLAAGMYVGLVVGLDARKPIARISAVASVCLIRGVSLWRGWETPGPRDLTPDFLRGRDADRGPVDAESPSDGGRP